MPGRRRLALLLSLVATSGAGCHETATEPPPPLAIQCSAVPASGPAPLTVAFALDVANATGVLSVVIQYGDGAMGGDPDARHVYAAAGDYVASFTVAAGIETARCSAAVSVAPAPAPVPTPRSVNQPPAVDFGTTPAATGGSITGKAPLRVDFNVCRTVDPDDDALYYKMDLDGDGSFEFHGASGADCRHGTSYPVGTRTASVCVTDLVCPSWPLCDDYQPLHPFQCRSYSISAVP